MFLTVSLYDINNQLTRIYRDYIRIFIFVKLFQMLYTSDKKRTPCVFSVKHKTELQSRHENTLPRVEEVIFKSRKENINQLRLKQ